MSVAIFMLHSFGFLITPLAPWHFTMLVDVGLRLDGGMTYAEVKIHLYFHLLSIPRVMAFFALTLLVSQIA